MQNDEQEAFDTIWRVAAQYGTEEQRDHVLAVAGAGMAVAVKLCNQLWDEIAKRPMRKRDRIQVAAQICKMFIHYEAMEFLRTPDRKADDDVSVRAFCQSFTKVIQRIAVDDADRVVQVYKEMK